MRGSRFACVVKAATGRYGRRIGRLKLVVIVLRRSCRFKLAAEEEKIVWPDNLHGMSVRQLVQPDRSFMWSTACLGYFTVDN
ncbi:hypothetical protein NEIELOOT_01464 [Neisseria elongata subsp. glycolytica ATCC 29315]|uniref:Uncharacterized protein n=1 Tax=Neisseria elongata subsp. glycolytica ATCC 29315 TaxID=546263 RepID=D4DQX1_NEIEG|nr:hypothetical protein NEIELOOT_01464 [Neisseria elongata subsp. glycolytica ATCC 29315]